MGLLWDYLTAVAVVAIRRWETFIAFIPGEASLAEIRLTEVRVPRCKGRSQPKPIRVIDDRTYESDPLSERLKERGIELIVQYRKKSRRCRYEDRLKLRRYKYLWIIERSNPWLGQFPGCLSPIGCVLIGDNVRSSLYVGMDGGLHCPLAPILNQACAYVAALITNRLVLRFVHVL